MDTKTPTGRAAFWDQVYATKTENQVSWYQDNPEPSFGLIRSATSDLSASIIDVGGGASHLPDALLDSGYTDVTVLDVSSIALERAKARLGIRAAQASWITADVTRWKPQRQWRVWHDRAVFHFLTSREDQEAYVKALTQATANGSVVIVATFAPSGPERCSGLPVQRYSAEALSARLGAGFRIGHRTMVAHKTPFGSTQDFVFGVFRRV